MDRLQEIERKHDQLRDLMAQHSVGAIWLRRARNIAWFTAGADAVIAADGENGAFNVLVTPERRAIVTDPIEAPRIRDEEKIEDLGFIFDISPWYARQLPSGEHVATDDGEIGDAITTLRRTLLPSEQDRARALGADTGAAIEQAVGRVEPGDTEFEIASYMAAACRERGGLALVTLVATDERTMKYRHAYATFKPLEKYAMLVVCCRRGGLVMSATRFVHFGAIPADLTARNQKVAAIDAAAMVNTRPGRTQGDVFADIQAAYAAQGEADQWQLHHQGGLAGYASREAVATPGDLTRVNAGQVYAWNPSIPGCKSEDTILIAEGGFEILTATGNYPTVDASVGGQTVKRPAILER
ncbi:MAG: M24 family metallopeptidase [Chloroflexota bacterium]|nr:M24 family metallopeptidase [Chloroflexota bacterium]